MPELGYALSCEEHGPLRLVRNAARAEDAGFSFALISDHFHPWTDRQGETPFVWAVIGGIANATERLRLGTGVTCPTIRIHPAIVAHASATAAMMLEGRFFLGVGSGENLNEHVLADRWPPARDRLDMLEEAVEVIRELWTGKLVSHRGRHYRVVNARLYTTPEEPPEVYVAAGGEAAADVAGRIGDGLILASPGEEVRRERRRGQAALRPVPRLLGAVRGRREADRARVVPQHRVAGGAVTGAAPAGALRAGRAAPVGGRHGRHRGLRTRSRAARGDDQALRGCRLRRRLPPPDRPRPGRLLRLLRARGASALSLRAAERLAQAVKRLGGPAAEVRSADRPVE